MIFGNKRHHNLKKKYYSRTSQMKANCKKGSLMLAPPGTRAGEKKLFAQFLCV